ncbi:hypothetical protein Q9189_007866, partial [Teloschistes chrysophthalmus]
MKRGIGDLDQLFSTLGKQRPNDASTFATDHFTHTDSSAEELAGKDVTGEVGSRDDVNSLDQYYVPIDTYEGRHRYDPKAAWTLEEEKALIRRLDIRVCAYCCLMFFCLQLDRGNISQALSDNMLKDLGLNTNDYNTGQTIFYVSFLAAELPSQLVSKKLGPMVSWSIVAACQARLTGKATFFLTRSLLGIIEGGFIPDIILYLSYFYKGKELPTRQAVTPKLLWAALTDYDIWPIYLLGFTWTTPNQCVVAYLTLILRSLKFDPFETNLLTVPAWTLFILQLLFWTWLSERINNRYVIILACQIYMLPVLIGLETLGGGQAHAWARYALSVMMVGFPYVHAII